MREARLYEQLPDSAVGCNLCPHACHIAEGERGICGVRLNHSGVLYAETYGRVAAVHVDPIEKKPLYHFIPGTGSLSVGTYGCNLDCGCCQNAELSHPGDFGVLRFAQELLATSLVDHCIERKLPSISFTYNEPTVFIEYAGDVASLAHIEGIRTVFVTNGYITREALLSLEGLVDAMNIDLKSMRDGFYQQYCGGRLGPVLETIALARQLGIWVEVTTLVIPGLTDSSAELLEAAQFLASIDPALPWHVTAFHPERRMQDRPATPVQTLHRARAIGLEAGLLYVYTGNISDEQGSATYCPGCKARVIERSWHSISTMHLAAGKCAACNRSIEGVWQ